jgi:hypothetical protein
VVWSNGSAEPRWCEHSRALGPVTIRRGDLIQMCMARRTSALSVAVAKKQPRIAQFDLFFFPLGYMIFLLLAQFASPRYLQY